MPPAQLVNLLSSWGTLWGLSASTVFTLLSIVAIVIITLIISHNINSKDKNMTMFIFMGLLFFFTVIGFVDWIVFLLTGIIFVAIYSSMRGRTNG